MGNLLPLLVGYHGIRLEKVSQGLNLTMSMSPRQQVAQNLAELCVFGDLNDAYGVSCERATDSKGKPHWLVLFCKARVLDGVIRVYSDRFILITWKGMGQRDGKQVCRSADEAKEFLINTFIKKFLWTAPSNAI